MQTKPHESSDVKRIREILGIKEETFAINLSLSQQAISSLEQKETLDVPTLVKVAKTLGVNTEAIKNFNDEAVISIISNSFQDFRDNAVASAMNYQRTCNLDKFRWRR